MSIQWTEVGKEYTEGKQDNLLAIIEKMEWRPVTEKMSLPLMPGMGINGAIKEFGIPNVSDIAISHALAPCGLYGIYGHYPNAHVKCYFLDTGVEVVSILQVVEEVQ